MALSSRVHCTFDHTLRRHIGKRTPVLLKKVARMTGKCVQREGSVFRGISGNMAFTVVIVLI